MLRLPRPSPSIRLKAANCSSLIKSLGKTRSRKKFGTTFVTVSMPLFRGSTSRFWPTDSQARANPTRWALPARLSKVIRILWVSRFPFKPLLPPIAPSHGENVKITELLSAGIVPRAAAALFNQLAGPPPLRRHGSSGLRTPTRYSTTSPPTLSSLARANANENWQLKATYVEVFLDRC